MKGVISNTPQFIKVGENNSTALLCIKFLSKFKAY